MIKQTRPLFTTKPMGTKLLSKICKRTLTPRVLSLPTGSYTLLRKEEEEKEDIHMNSYHIILSRLGLPTCSRLQYRALLSFYKDYQ